ncbi:hypothetical protein K491DRAFT_411905 [Lophiostoma macrostomum CBS 122681]|uniref:Zn(2)-C6 fungal-type domain-containing protein n=1 Tax=Lophiostoma macrostomum CBS 122681 TaxID=1314788 RepID=A0A6A6T7J0_9PLEO|nr:hypothetical protein K491DRAFT_411905 [Lophiostoma macrostomum CBS 122681]
MKMASTSKKENWTTHEGACASCRTRKIRCGREKPSCSSCCRDSIECVYSPPPKRVNQVKVLTQNFDDISDRLAMMQGELSLLTAIFKRADIAERLKLDLDGDLPSVEAVTPSTTSPPLSRAGHVLRDDRTLMERYHGPCTLVALCRSFESDLTSHVGPNDEVTGKLLRKMLIDMSTHDDLDLELGVVPDDTICLPPKQFLSVMLDTFLSQADYGTDIFCPQTIYEAVERVYRDPSSPGSQSWALCFNLIILLTLGAEQPVRNDDPFVRPILQAAHVAARKPSFFMSLRLVNVQALALLSLLAQQYHTETFGDSIFAQVCILAKAIGLHRAGHGGPSDLSPTEAEERQKVFRSLYIRDRYSTTAYGAQSWLPNRPRATSGETQGTSAWELAKLQDDLERLCSADNEEVVTPEHLLKLSRVQEQLNTWSQTYSIPSSARPAPRDVFHHLAFLGTRIRALGTHNPANATQLLYDARLSCLLVATFCSPLSDEAQADRLDRLLRNQLSTHSATNRSRPSSTSSPSPPFFSTTTSSVMDAPQRSGLLTPGSQAAAHAPLPIHRLVNVFPTAAVFILARNILGIHGSASQQSQVRASNAFMQENSSNQHERNEDISLLESLLFCFRSGVLPPTARTTTGHMPHPTYISKLASLLQHLVFIIRSLNDPTSSSSSSSISSSSAFPNDLHLLDVLGTSTNDLNLHNFHPYTTGSDSGSHTSPSFFTNLPLSSTTTTGPNSSDASFAMTPISVSGIPDTPFDITQFLNRMGSVGSPGMWDTSDMALQQPQQPQYLPDQPSAARRGRGRKKRARTNSVSDDQDEEVNFQLD